MGGGAAVAKPHSAVFPAAQTVVPQNVVDNQFHHRKTGQSVGHAALSAPCLEHASRSTDCEHSMQHVPIKVCCAELSLFLCPSVGETPETEMRRPHRRGTDSLPRNVTIPHTSQPRSVTCFRSNIDRRATQGIARAAAKLISLRRLRL